MVKRGMSSIDIGAVVSAALAVGVFVSACSTSANTGDSPHSLPASSGFTTRDQTGSSVTTLTTTNALGDARVLGGSCTNSDGVVPDRDYLDADVAAGKVKLNDPSLNKVYASRFPAASIDHATVTNDSGGLDVALTMRVAPSDDPDIKVDWIVGVLAPLDIIVTVQHAGKGGVTNAALYYTVHGWEAWETENFTVTRLLAETDQRTDVHVLNLDVAVQNRTVQFKLPSDRPRLVVRPGDAIQLSVNLHVPAPEGAAERGTWWAMHSYCAVETLAQRSS